jgi:small subunit ribosomal protein S17
MVKKERIGIVVSNKSQKTVIVSVQRRYPDPKYGKIVIQTKRFMAHDPYELSQCGDVVVIQESSPFSKNKKWLLQTIFKKYQSKALNSL